MLDREHLGEIVRNAWINWAQVQPNCKPSWLVPWENLSEAEKEADRRIGEAVARNVVGMFYHFVEDSLPIARPTQPQCPMPDCGYPMQAGSAYCEDHEQERKRRARQSAIHGGCKAPGCQLLAYGSSYCMVHEAYREMVKE